MKARPTIGRALAFLFALALGLGLLGCVVEEGFCGEGPPLRSTLYENSSTPPAAFAGLPVDGDFQVQVEAGSNSVLVSFMSEGRLVEQRYSVTNVNQLHGGI